MSGAIPSSLPPSHGPVQPILDAEPAPTTPATSEGKESSLTPQQKECFDTLQMMGFDKAASLDAAMFSNNVERALEFASDSPDKRKAFLDSMAELQGMGIGVDESRAALTKFKGNVPQAIDWIFSKAAATPATTTAAPPKRAVVEAKKPAETKRTTSSSTAATPSSSSGAAVAEIVVPDEDVKRDYLVHKAAWWCDTDSLHQYLKRGLANQLDHRNNTPMSLAFKLGHFEAVNYLVQRGADPRIKTGKGWTVLQEACLMKNRQVVSDLHLHTVMLRQQEWERNLPNLQKTLAKIPDFYMEIDWKVETWVPFVAKMAPSDTFRLWKKGGKLRFDSNVRGMDGTTVIRGLTSFMFTEASLFMVDHVNETFHDALAEFRNPSFESIESSVEGMLANHEVESADIISDNITFKPKKSLFGSEKKEKIAGYDCKLCDMDGLRFSVVSVRKENKGAAWKPPPMPSYDEYFAPKKEEPKEEKKKKPVAVAAKAPAKAAALPSPAPPLTTTTTITAATPSPATAAAAAASSEGVATTATVDSAAATTATAVVVGEKKETTDKLSGVVKVEDGGMSMTYKDLSASLWLSSDFPLPVSSLVEILEIVSPASPHVARIHQILSSKLPPGFPVKLLIPVVTQINAAVVFSKFERTSCDDDIFVIPPSFRER